MPGGRGECGPARDRGGGEEVAARARSPLALSPGIVMHRDSCPLDCKVYVGNLGNNGNKTELERAFGYYGPLRSVWVARNPPGFAFVEFEDPRDAADAVRELDGRTLCALEMIIAEEVLLLAADHREGEAFLVAAAGPSPETEEERDRCPGKEIISLPVPFPGLVVVLGQMRGNKTFGRSCVQEVRSEDRKRKSDRCKDVNLYMVLKRSYDL
ncbi:serine/arginine-rich splicing factor 3 [Alligator mississippiensis]|uniref:Serine/arginine-rich splicing factor 3 n=1 Tax=Alligator mississippiensis TaxID=8496 RepID=A0A151N8N6_ALLMI|nr:serine/arginine-rich splicing factor 3 [Alligator mississippiensis]